MQGYPTYTVYMASKSAATSWTQSVIGTITAPFTSSLKATTQVLQSSVPNVIREIANTKQAAEEEGNLSQKTSQETPAEQRQKQEQRSSDNMYKFYGARSPPGQYLESS